MYWTNPIFFILILSGPVVFITGLILMIFPPKKINGIYGYRTPGSMKSQDRWDFAQKYSGKRLIQSGIILTLISFIGLLIKPIEGLGTVAGFGIMLIFTAVPIIQTENKLKKMDKL